MNQCRINITGGKHVGQLLSLLMYLILAPAGISIGTRGFFTATQSTEVKIKAIPVCENADDPDDGRHAPFAYGDALAVQVFRFADSRAGMVIDHGVTEGPAGKGRHCHERIVLWPQR